ncbi:MAG: hypothetical protein H7175_08490 [Burkholderiales bacterium]|nr:hypothetical protein [Anaerolineae bacterium]
MSTLEAQFDHELTTWLDAATRGLPADVKVMARAEFAAHYADAFDDHMEQGLSAAEAQREALAELGDVAETARGLQDTHLAERRYGRAAAASMVYPVAFLVLSSGMVQPWSVADILYSCAILLPALYVMRSLKALLRLRYNFSNINRSVSVFWLGTLLLTLPPALSWLLLGEPVTSEAVRYSLTGVFNLPQGVLNITYLIGVFVSGLGMIYVGDRLMHLKDGLYGLRTILFGALWLTGGALLTLGSSYIVMAYNYSITVDLIASVAVVGVIFMYIVTNALLTLLFFRAVYRKAPRPMQAA